MTRAYVLVKREAGKAKQALGQIAKLPGVKMAHTCWGQPDIFSFVEIPNERDLAALVLSTIQKMDGVIETETHIVAEV